MLAGILWFIGSFIVGAIIGGILGDIAGEIVCFVDDIICLIPIPKIFSRIIVIVGSSVLVYLFTEGWWFWGLIAWMPKKLLEEMMMIYNNILKL